MKMFRIGYDHDAGSQDSIFDTTGTGYIIVNDLWSEAR